MATFAPGCKATNPAALQKQHNEFLKEEGNLREWSKMFYLMSEAGKTACARIARVKQREAMNDTFTRVMKNIGTIINFKQKEYDIKREKLR